MSQDSLTMHSMRLDANIQVSRELGVPRPERVLLSTERRVSAAPPGYLRSVLAAEGILEDRAQQHHLLGKGQAQREERREDWRLSTRNYIS